MADYGEYNGEITKKKKNTFDSKNTSSTNAMKRVIVKDFSESQVKEGPYVGYVLRVDEGEGFTSLIKSIFSPQWAAKVRIPELDAHIPEPSDFPNPTDEKEIQKIEMHPTYFPKSSKGVDKPKAGAKVLVERDSNGENNFIIEILDKEGVSEKPTQTGDAKKAHGGGLDNAGSKSVEKGEKYVASGSVDNTLREGGITGFRRYKFRNPPDSIVVHESGGNNYKTTESVLKNKGCGVHFLAGENEVIQYEGVEHYLIHCPGFNRRSIGVEFNHAYHGKDNLLEPARFYWKKKYNIPSVEKLENCYALVSHICEITGIPFVMPQYQNGKFNFRGGIAKGMTTGVTSHVAASPNHADGNYPCLYFAIRQAGNNPQEAWDIAYEIAKVATTTSVHEIPIGNGDSTPKQITIQQKTPLTRAERKEFPNYV